MKRRNKPAAPIPLNKRCRAVHSRCILGFFGSAFAISRRCKGERTKQFSTTTYDVHGDPSVVRGDMRVRLAIILALLLAVAAPCAGQDASSDSSESPLEDSSEGDRITRYTRVVDSSAGRPKFSDDSKSEGSSDGDSLIADIDDDSSKAPESSKAESSSDANRIIRMKGKWKSDFPVKRGLSATPFSPKGPDGDRDQTAPCWDSRALNLQSNWYFNWGPIPMDCKRPFTKEFAPMIWTCWRGNCTNHLPPNFRELWKAAGVKFLQGYNEPSLPRQGSLTPREGAELWKQIDELALSFSPPLRLVGPAMVGWSSRGGSGWLEEFLSLLSPQMRDRIEFLSQHDYSGSVKRIKKNADACYEKYGKKVWLTEFAVGRRSLGGNRMIASREDQNTFLRKALRMLDSADSIYRYAWYSTRNGNFRPTYNSDGSWASELAYVTESSLLPPGNKQKNRWDWKMAPTSTGSVYAPKEPRWATS